MTARRGFTLVEMMVAVSIFAVAAVALGAAFKSGITTWRRVERAADLHQEARFAFDRLARDLRNAVPAPGTAMTGQADALELWTARRAPGDPSLPRLARVSYRMETGAPARIERTGTDAPTSIPLAAAPARLTFSFAYAGEPVRWENAWSEPAVFPAAVRATLVLFDEGREAIFQRVIDLPGGSLVPWKGAP